MTSSRSEASPDQSGSTPPATPKTFGKFVIKGRLGHGGMGIVLDALTPEGQPVALKLIRPTGDAEKRKMFSARLQREAKILKVLSHPGVVRLIDSGTIHGILYLAMERVDGKSLGALLKHGPMDAELVISLGVKIGDTLAHLHEIGIVHRDIKPDNVIINHAGNPVLTDFGLSRLSGNTAITRADELVGSLGYIAPEILEGAQPSPKTDQYALGRLLFNLSAGEPPKLENVPIYEQITRSLKTDWSRFPTKDVFRRFGGVIRHMIRTRPENRFPDMYACLVELDNLLRPPGDAGDRGASPIEQPSKDTAPSRPVDIELDDEEAAPDTLPPDLQSSMEPRPGRDNQPTEKHPIVTAEQLRERARATDWSIPPPEREDSRPVWDDDTLYHSATGLARELTAAPAKSPWLAADLNAPAALPTAELSIVDPEDEDGEYPCLSISVADFPAPRALKMHRDERSSAGGQSGGQPPVDLPATPVEDAVSNAADSVDLIVKMRKRSRIYWSDESAESLRVEPAVVRDKAALAAHLRKKTQAYWRSKLSAPGSGLAELALDQGAPADDAEAPQAAANWAHIVGDLIAPLAGPAVAPRAKSPPPAAVTEPSGQVPRMGSEAVRWSGDDWEIKATSGLGSSDAPDLGSASSARDLWNEATHPEDRNLGIRVVVGVGESESGARAPSGGSLPTGPGTPSGPSGGRRPAGGGGPSGVRGLSGGRVPSGGSSPSAASGLGGGRVPGGGTSPSAGSGPAGGRVPGGGSTPSAGSGPGEGRVPGGGSSPSAGSGPSGGAVPIASILRPSSLVRAVQTPPADSAPDLPASAARASDSPPFESDLGGSTRPRPRTRWTFARSLSLGLAGLALGFVLAVIAYHLGLVGTEPLPAPEVRRPGDSAAFASAPLSEPPSADAPSQPLFRYEGEGPAPQSTVEVAKSLAAEALGVVRRGDLERAERMLGLCVKLADLPECHRGLGNILAKRRSPASRAHYQRYLETTPEPDSPEAEEVRRLLAPPR